ncbi:MAG TPA: Gmad2 immunoglobulin-like domain-containing protein [Chloroflexaceae bacterium]|nr:Gmad2 immunoglobulin-like domain-containing protein [Chloroflexaceae bacterium]
MCQPDPPRARARRPGLLILLALAVALGGCGLFGRPPAATPQQPTSALGSRTITILAPQGNAVVTSPIGVNGAVSVMPNSGNLTYRLFGPDGALLAQGSFPAQGSPGAPGTFAGSVPYTLAQQGTGRLEVLEINPADGAILAITSLQVVLSPGQAPPAGTPGVEPTTTGPAPTALPPPSPSAQQQILIDSPPAGTTVGSPVVVTGRTTRVPAGNTLSYVMRDAANAVLGAGTFPVQASSANTGAFNASLTFNLPPNGGNIALEVFEPGAGGAAPVASARLALVVAPPQAIVIDSPPPGTTVGSPVTLTGRTARYPFQGNLGYRVLDAGGRQLGGGTFPVAGAPGGPASFTASLNFSLPPNGGRTTVEIFDQNAANGQIAALARIELNVAPPQQAIVIESPPPNTQVGSPMTVAGRLVRLPAGNQLTYRVRDRNGQEIGAGTFGVSGSQDGGARFNAQIFFNLPPGGGPIGLELLELDPATGQVRTSATLTLTVAGPPPTVAPPTNTPVPTRQAVTIETPPSGTVVGSPVVITGRVALYPQFRELYYVVRTLTRETLGQGSFPVAGQPGQTNVPYVASLTFAEPPSGGAILVEVYDRDGVGQVIASAIVQLQVSPRNPPTPTSNPAGGGQRITITAPVTDTVVGVPAIVDGGAAIAPYQGQLDYTVSDGAGAEIGAGTIEVRNVPGLGFIFSAPILFNEPPAGGPITLRIFDRNEDNGAILAEQTIRLQVAPGPYPRPAPRTP